jgi:integrase
LPVGAIDEPLVLAVLKPIWATKTVTAGRVRTRIAAVLDFANAAGYRSGTNPARWEGNLEHLLRRPEKIATVKHMPALPYAELPTFMTELRGVAGVAARTLEFTVLTAARTGEVIGARWSELDLVNAVWTVPAARMKAGKEHRVPLAQQSVALLRALPREGDMVFPGTKAGSAIGNVAMFRVLKALRPDITVHGFRSTFRVWAEERTAFPAIVPELALAHAVGSAVERTTLYDHRVRLMQAWADFFDVPMVAPAVLPLRRERA